jgi:hypothetical protein
LVAGLINYQGRTSNIKSEEDDIWRERTESANNRLNAAIGKDNRPKQLAVVESAGTYGISQGFTCVKGRLIGIKKGLNMVIAHICIKEESHGHVRDPG